MSTTTFDTEQFNEAAQVLFDEARRRGYEEGEKEGRLNSANWQARGNLDLAERMFRTASAADVQACRFLTMYARKLLYRTPILHKNITEVGARLSRESWLNDSSKEPNRTALTDVIALCEEALAEMGGYR